MGRFRSLGGAAVLAAALIPVEVDAAAEPAPALTADEPGPQYPPAGRSLFDELFERLGRYDVPYPFERLLAELDRQVAPATIRTALIPLGRSLQRYAAHPDYFESPRLVVAVDAEGDEPAEWLLKDRLFLGFQPAADAIEVISYNEVAGRFEFQEVVGYGRSATADVRYASREVCLNCHQAHGPIFPRPLWSETNADEAIAGRLAGLGERYHGAPVRQGIDAVDDFDRSTDRANRMVVVNLLWSRGCGEGSDGMACRLAILREAFRYRLVGARAEWRPAVAPEIAQRLHDRLTQLWPGGLGTPSPDLVNRAPLMNVPASGDLAGLLEMEGEANPETRRPLALQWTAGATAADTFGNLARDIAQIFTAADIGWLDARLAAFGTAPVTYRAICGQEQVVRSEERVELRLECGEKAGDLRLSGFVVLTGLSVEDARVDSLAVGDAGTIRRLRLASGTVVEDDYPKGIRLVLEEGTAGLSGRLLTGRRIAELSIRNYGSRPILRLETLDDLPALDAALGSLASAGILDDKPFDRRAILSGLAHRLAEE